MFVSINNFNLFFSGIGGAETRGRDNIWRTESSTPNSSKFSSHQRHSGHPRGAPCPARSEETTQGQILVDKAFEKAVAIKTSFQNGMPVLVVDVTPAQFEVAILIFYYSQFMKIEPSYSPSNPPPPKKKDSMNISLYLYVNIKRKGKTCSMVLDSIMCVASDVWLLSNAVSNTLDDPGCCQLTMVRVNCNRCNPRQTSG